MWERMLSIISNIASLLGLFVSIFAAWKVRNIKSERVREKRTPILVEKIVASTTELSLLIVPNALPNNKNEIEVKLVELQGFYASLATKMPKKNRANVSSIITDIKNVVSMDYDKMWILYKNCLLVNNTLKLEMEDLHV